MSHTLKACTKCSESLPLDKFSRDSTRANGFHPWCNSCRKASEQLRIQRNPAKQRARVANWRAKNPDRTRKIDAVSHARNKEKRNAYSREYRAANLERMRELGRAWAHNNPEATRAINAARRAAKKQAIPAWARSEFDAFMVQECYDLAVRRTKVLGFEWHVDHIVPLRSEIVCGLHCSANLQVIPSAINHAKGNRAWPHMPDTPRGPGRNQTPLMQQIQPHDESVRASYFATRMQSDGHPESMRNSLI